jgi:hypothetical protein
MVDGGWWILEGGGWMVDGERSDRIMEKWSNGRME